MNKLILSIIAACSFGVVNAQKEGVEQLWYNQEKTSKIQVYKATDGFFYGKIVWLKDPKDKQGQPRKDIKNNNEKLRQSPIMNLVILKKFKKTATNTFEEGTVYDPLSGKTYCGKLTLQGSEIKLKGFICGMSFLGRTSTWVPATE